MGLVRFHPRREAQGDGSNAGLIVPDIFEALSEMPDSTCCGRLRRILQATLFAIGAATGEDDVLLLAIVPQRVIHECAVVVGIRFKQGKRQPRRSPVTASTMKCLFAKMNWESYALAPARRHVSQYQRPGIMIVARQLIELPGRDADHLPLAADLVRSTR